MVCCRPGPSSWRGQVCVARLEEDIPWDVRKRTWRPNAWTRIDNKCIVDHTDRQSSKVLDVSEDDAVPKLAREFGMISLGEGANAGWIEQGGNGGQVMPVKVTAACEV